MTHKNYFGIFSRDHNEELKIVCHLFKCLDESVCDEILHSLKQSSLSSAKNNQPIKLYHLLCKKMATKLVKQDNSSVEKSIDLTAKFIVDNLKDNEQKKIKQQYEESEKSLRPTCRFDRLVIVMAILRHISEEKQKSHETNNRNQDVRDRSNSVGKAFSMFRNRAKQSLSNVGNMLEKGVARMQIDQPGGGSISNGQLTSPVEKLKFTFDSARSVPSTPSPKPKRRFASGSSKPILSRVRTLSSSSAEDFTPSQPIRIKGLHGNSPLAKPLDSSRFDMKPLIPSALERTKLNGSLRSLSSESTPAGSYEQSSILNEIATFYNVTGEKEKLATPAKKSIYHEIYTQVVTPRKNRTKIKDIPEYNASDENEFVLKTPDDIRRNWKRAIKDQILLNRIKKVEKKICFQRPESALTSLKLNYDVIEEPSIEMEDVWSELLGGMANKNQCKMDLNVFKAGAAKGISREKRGEVWTLFYQQWKLHSTSKDGSYSSNSSRNTSLNNSTALHNSSSSSSLHNSFPSENTVNYKELLKKLTTHQHAILIDLGRTFPNHKYFNEQLGVGQLHLFNILKAYSLHDEGLGYCQGLSFVAGFILLHTETAESAFDLLTHILINLKCRSLYLPDMAALQLSMYQLSRLLFEYQKDLYDHLQINDVDLMLFSTPWFLTMFTSILPFGMTARIFDLVMLEGVNALFKASLCLLLHHSKKILEIDNFEDIVDYLKTKLVDMTAQEQCDVIQNMFSLDIDSKLRVYQVEYTVMEDNVEVFTSDDTVEKLRNVNETISNYNRELLEQLETSRTQIASLQQGLDDFARIDERRSLELLELRKRLKKYES